LIDLTLMKKLIRFVLCLALLAAGAPHIARAESESQEPPPFAISPRHGQITSYQPGKGADRQKQLVVLIQDLHANVGVQKNIAGILYRLQRVNKRPSVLVCVEGASGEGDVSLLRSLPGPIRHAFEAMLLRRAYLTGAELAATEAAADWPQQQVVIWDRVKRWFSNSGAPAPVSLSPIQLWGVDDPDLYRKNWHAAKTVDRQHYEALEYVKSLRGMLTTGGDTGALQKHLELLTKLLLLRLQPGEYKEYVKGRALNPKGPAIYQNTVAAAETYYQAAEARSHAMAQNVIAKMGRTPGVTALVTGGFHSQEIADEFKKMGLSYVIITPRVDVLDQDEAYRARLREEE
jgi:hypothetical protein